MVYIHTKRIYRIQHYLWFQASGLDGLRMHPYEYGDSIINMLVCVTVTGSPPEITSQTKLTANRKPFFPGSCKVLSIHPSVALSIYTKGAFKGKDHILVSHSAAAGGGLHR